MVNKVVCNVVLGDEGCSFVRELRNALNLGLGEEIDQVTDWILLTFRVYKSPRSDFGDHMTEKLIHVNKTL